MRSIVHQALDVRRSAVPNLVFHCGRRHCTSCSVLLLCTQNATRSPRVSTKHCLDYALGEYIETAPKQALLCGGGCFARSIRTELRRRGYRHCAPALPDTVVPPPGYRNMAAIMARPPFHDQKTGVRYDCNNPDHAGWLRKESAWLKDWRPRFFVLKGSNLFFAKVG